MVKILKIIPSSFRNNCLSLAMCIFVGKCLLMIILGIGFQNVWGISESPANKDPEKKQEPQAMEKQDRNSGEYKVENLQGQQNSQAVASLVAQTGSQIGSGSSDGSPISIVNKGQNGLKSTPSAASTSTSSIKLRSEDPQGCVVGSAAMEDLNRQRGEIESARKALIEKESELLNFEKALKEEIKNLEMLRAEITKNKEQLKKEQQEKISKLVETIESMNPKSGAQLLSSLDENLAITVMFQVSTQKLAKIMSAMETQKSSRLTELLTGVRNQKVKAGDVGVAKSTPLVSTAEGSTNP